MAVNFWNFHTVRKRSEKSGNDDWWWWWWLRNLLTKYPKHLFCFLLCEFFSFFFWNLVPRSWFFRELSSKILPFPNLVSEFLFSLKNRFFTLLFLNFLSCVNSHFSDQLNFFPSENFVLFFFPLKLISFF